MADLVPQTAAVPASAALRPGLLAPLTDAAGGPALERLRAFSRQPAVRGFVPWLIGVSALGGMALAWSALAPAPQRQLYAQLDDSERSSVVASLDKAAIGYSIDNATGAVSVDEQDFYRARMLVAADGSLAAPQGGDGLIDSLPMGASRALEGQRLRAARERDLMMTIQEIDGVEAVRVHLAEAEKSVFVRDNVPPSASVMLRLARGRQLSASQVTAVVNLVAASVPGLAPEAVRVVDQHGRLLSDGEGGDSDRLQLQSRMEQKLRAQLDQLLTPILGQDNFTSEIQVELDMDEVTRARESYDKDGAVRSETQAQSQSAAAATAAGVPGVLSNTPPLAATAQPGAPQGTRPPTGQPPQGSGEQSSTRTYELGREVSVANAAPGGIRRLSVAVAISAAAMKGGKAADLDQIRQIVSAAVGADNRRGDQVAVISRKFEPVSEEALPFHEAAWFGTALRSGAALLAVLLVLLLGVRPLIRTLRRDAEGAESHAGAPGDGEDEAGQGMRRDPDAPIDPAQLGRQVGMAQRLAAEQPESAVAAIRQMLGQAQGEGAAEAVR